MLEAVFGSCANSFGIVAHGGLTGTKTMAKYAEA
jgi:hypothetical protein